MSSEFGLPEDWRENTCEYCGDELDRYGICMRCNWEDYHDL